MNRWKTVKWGGVIVSFGLMLMGCGSNTPGQGMEVHTKVSKMEPVPKNPSIQVPQQLRGYFPFTQALIIGVEKFADKNIPQLQYARRDAEGLSRLLRSSSSVSGSNIQVLLDENAHKKKIMEAFEGFKKVTPDDRILIYFAGHGTTKPGSDGGRDAYLVPFDTNVQNLESTAIPMNVIASAMEMIPTQNVIFIIDSCYSGNSIGRSFPFGPQTRDFDDPKPFVSAIAGKEGRVVITSAKPNQVALELDNLKHGLFSYFLLEAMRGFADQDGNGLVSLIEAYGYISNRVVQVSKELGWEQNPQFSGALVGDPPLAVRMVSKGSVPGRLTDLIRESKRSFLASKLVVISDARSTIELYVNDQFHSSWKMGQHEITLPRSMFTRNSGFARIRLRATSRNCSVWKNFDVEQGKEIQMYLNCQETFLTLPPAPL